MQWKCIGSVAVATWDPVPTILMVTTESPTAQSLPCHACQSISLSSVYPSICPSIISVSGSGLHPRAILPPQPQGLLAMSRDIFGPHHWVGGATGIWWVRKGCFSTPHSAQDTPSRRIYLTRNVTSAKLEKPLWEGWHVLGHFGV